MNELGVKKQGSVHPAVAEEFRKIVAKIEKVTNRNRQLAVQIRDEKKAREALERQEVHLDEMPGKRVPFKYQINIPIPGLTDSPITGEVNIGRDGPFVCRRIYASALFTDAPLIENPVSPGIFVDYSFIIGRYFPVSSREVYGLSNPGIFAKWSLFFPIINLDFEWSYKDSGSGRNREDKPISGDILTRRDDDGFLMNNEIFAAGSVVSFTFNPTRTVGFIDANWLVGEILDPDTFLERVLYPVESQLQVTFDGYKVLQPLEM